VTKDSPNFALTVAGPLDLREQLGYLPANGTSGRYPTSLCAHIRGAPSALLRVRIRRSVTGVRPLLEGRSDRRRWRRDTPGTTDCRSA
jgi:hypothetical protein